jgi:hypothetical protein
LLIAAERTRADSWKWFSVALALGVAAFAFFGMLTGRLSLSPRCTVEVPAFELTRPDGSIHIVTGTLPLTETVGLNAQTVVSHGACDLALTYSWFVDDKLLYDKRPTILLEPGNHSSGQTIGVVVYDGQTIVARRWAVIKK